MASDEKIMKDAQYRKGLSIAFFNATNSAIALTTTYKPMQEEVHEFIVRHRDWMLEEHKEYYARVIASVGSVYNVADSIKKFDEVKTREELKLVWHALSPDERNDGEIRKVVKELKSKLK